MSSDLLRCPECGAALDYYSDQMAHRDWHRTLQGRLSDLEQRIEVLERQRREEVEAKGGVGA